MSIKAITLAAAAVAITATSASANNFFSAEEWLEDRQVLELGTVTSDAAGVVEIYDFRTGSQGALLGSTDVRGGANTNVKVNIGNQTSEDVLAVLKINGAVVAVEDFDLVD